MTPEKKTDCLSDKELCDRYLYSKRRLVLNSLLRDHNDRSPHPARRNIIWAVLDKSSDLFYQQKNEIQRAGLVNAANVIVPRAYKEKKTREQRVKDMAEVFTPVWICNRQNNLIDEAWFGRPEVFNTEEVDEQGVPQWRDTEGKIDFTGVSSRHARSWQKYVRDIRLEITCGEAPYLVSRYDTITGTTIAVKHRIGLLDRKLRVVSENTDGVEDWVFWAKEAVKSIYGFEWQGDSLFLARKNLLFTVLDYYNEKFGEYPDDLRTIKLNNFAYIISWNLWQMDGLKMEVPYSGGIKCHLRDWRLPRNKQVIPFESLFADSNAEK